MGLHCLKKAVFAVCLLHILFLLAACGARKSPTVIIVGSTSVLPYAEMLAQEYETLFPDNERVDPQGGGSTAGIVAVMSGTADIGMSSRALNEDESHLWQVEIAKDGLAVIVHPDNGVDNLTLDQIRSIYTMEITNWSEVGGNDAKIHVISREEGSGTRSAFQDLVVGSLYRITPKAIIQDSNGAMKQLVSDDPNSIGFISLGLMDHTVKSLQLDGAAASIENVVNGSYPLYRPFILVSLEEPTGPAKQFIDFIFSPEGRKILIDEGLVV